jgi:hypothetical protein
MAQWQSYPTFTGPFTGQEQLLAASSTSPGAGMIRIPWYAVATMTTTVTGGPFLRLSGGTMAGPLYLFEDPVSPTEAATKAYVDAAVSGIPGSGIVSATVNSVTGNAITVAAGTNYVICNDSTHAVNTLTVGSGSLTDGYTLWLTFPNGGVFSGQIVAANGILTLKVLGGGWTMVSKVG